MISCGQNIVYNGPPPFLLSENYVAAVRYESADRRVSGIILAIFMDRIMRNKFILMQDYLIEEYI